MSLYVVAVCFPVVFIGELPDKTMFANLLLATRGRPLAVWAGAATAFVVHVAIAVTVGAVLYRLVPHRALDLAVAALFLVGAAVAWRQAGTKKEEEAEEEAELIGQEAFRHRLVVTAFIVIFVAEWGDLTQVLTANLAARYSQPLSVGLGAVLALWSVAALAVTAGRALARYVDTSVVRRLTSAVLLALAGFSAYAGAR